MGARLTKLSGSINAALLSVLDSSPAYRNKLLAMLQQYASDPSVSDAQGLQWSAERLVSDATNESHEIGSRFLPLLAQIELNNFDATTVTQCIAQGAMQYLEELKLDMNFHIRLFDCARKGQVEKLSSLSKFVDINYQNESGSTALMIAAHHNHPALVSHLLSVHAKVNIQDSLGWSALMFASREGHMRVVEILMEEDVGVEIDIATKTGITALMCAADAGHVQIVKLLLEKGANVNACTNAGDTALLQACHGGHTQVVKLLLHAAADVNVTGKHLCSPSLLASRFGCYEILELLIQFGADLSSQDDEGRTICDFEHQGQIAAAIQRGVVGRFNKMISKPASAAPFGSAWGRKPFGSGSVFAQEAISHAVPLPIEGGGTMNSAVSSHDNMQHSLLGSADSPVPKLPLHSTPHPSKESHAHSTARSHLHAVDDDEDDENSPSMSPVVANPAVAVNAGSRSHSNRSPSHDLLPNVRTRQSRMFSSAAETPSRSRAFYHHESIGEDGLTDEQLAAMEADVEQILHRREQQRSGKGANPVNERHVLTLDSNEAVQSIVKAARIESPRAGRKGARDDDVRIPRDAEALFVPQYRSTSDNVHQYEDEAYSNSHQFPSLQSDHEPRFHNYPTQNEEEEGASVNIRSDGPSSLNTVDEEDRNGDPKRHMARVHVDPLESNSYESVIHRPLHTPSTRGVSGYSASAPPPVSASSTLSGASTTSPYMRVLDEHLAMRHSPFTPDSLSTIATGDILGSPIEESDEKEQESPHQSASAVAPEISASASASASTSASEEPVSELRIFPRLHDADVAPSPLSTLTPGSLLVDSGPVDDETLLARELARLNAGLPVDAEHAAQVAAHLAEHAQPLATHTAHPGASTGAESQLLADPNAIPIRNPRRSDQLAKKEAAAAAVAILNSDSTIEHGPPQHVFALRNAIAEASERNGMTAQTNTDRHPQREVQHEERLRHSNRDDDAVNGDLDTENHRTLLEESNSAPHSPSSATSGSGPLIPSSSAASTSAQKRKARKAKRVLAEIDDAPTVPRVLSTSLSPSFSPTVAAPVLNSFHLGANRGSGYATDSNMSQASASRMPAHSRMSSASPASASASPSHSAHSSPVYSNTTSPATSRRGSASFAANSIPQVPRGAVTPPSASSSARSDQERLVDNWLLEHGFDSVSRSSLAGFTFADLYNLDLNDCTELLGEKAGATLFAKLKRKWKEAGVSAKPQHAAQAERERDKERERVREREKMLRQEEEDQPDEATRSAVNGILAAAAAAEFASDDGEQVEFDEKEEIQRYSRRGNSSHVTPGGAKTSSHLNAAAPLLLSPSPTLSASASPPASAPASAPLAQPVAAAVPRAASTSASSAKSFSFKDSIKSSFLSKPSNTNSPTLVPIAPPISLAKQPSFQSSSSSSGNVRVNASSVSVVSSTINSTYRSTQVQSIDDSILRNTADEVSPSVSSESASSTASSSTSSSILPIPLPIPALPSSEKIASVLAANAVAPAPTGYYTQDLLNSQKAWLASSLESLHFRLQGTSKREEMRKNQPHRLRRAQAQQNMTDESGDDEKHAETRANNVTNSQITIGHSSGPGVSAWDRLGEKLGESPDSTPTHSPLVNAAMQRTSHHMQSHGPSSRAVGSSHSLSNSNAGFSLSRGIHNTAGVRVMQPPPPPPPPQPKPTSKTSFSSDYLTSF